MNKPPVAKKNPFEFEIHGDTRIDNYHWMRLSDDQKNSEKPDSQTIDVINYLNSENEYQKLVMKDTEKLQQKLFNELRQNKKMTRLFLLK